MQETEEGDPVQAKEAVLTCLYSQEDENQRCKETLGAVAEEDGVGRGCPDTREGWWMGVTSGRRLGKSEENQENPGPAGPEGGCFG